MSFSACTLQPDRRAPLGGVVSVAMLTIGVGLFGVLTGFLANAFLPPKKAEPDANAPSSDDLRQEIEELKRLGGELAELAAAGAPPRQRRDYG
jgi:hypothetical protein